MGVTKQQENIVGTPIRTQIIVICHYKHKSLQQSQYWDKPLRIETSRDGLTTTPQNHQMRERET